MRLPTVASSEGAKRADASAIDGGIPSRALMQRAGAAAATEIGLRFPDLLAHGVVVATGSGNNGGDGWVVARALHATGIPVRVVECKSSSTTDAKAERQLAIDAGVRVDLDLDALVAGQEQLLVDALLGTGITSDEPLMGPIAKGVALLMARQRDGATVVALDVPSGADATSGMHVGSPRCSLTLAFGTLKRCHLVSRERCGATVLLDIGLGDHVDAAGAARLATLEWFARSVPAIAAGAHKGTRKKIAIIGGAEGMAGAAMLAARGALRSGAGMVKCVVARESLMAIQAGEPAALAAVWPESDEAFAHELGDWADVLLIGPGLGKRAARPMMERALRVFRGPVVLDADALNGFEGDAAALAPLIGNREALLTPHPAEFARLTSMDVDGVLRDRFEAPSALAATTRATVLLKGVPTTVASPSGAVMIVAEGTPILGTGGSGDVLGGIAATLLAQTHDAHLGGSLAAFAHGRAAALVSARQVRGFTLEDVLATLPDVWSLQAPHGRPPILCEIPAVGE
ncbi:MAG: NAD(P)H-hydrate dehydratase [Gemmatimonadota bacterium]